MYLLLRGRIFMGSEIRRNTRNGVIAVQPSEVMIVFILFSPVRNRIVFIDNLKQNKKNNTFPIYCSDKIPALVYPTVIACART